MWVNDSETEVRILVSGQNQLTINSIDFIGVLREIGAGPRNANKRQESFKVFSSVDSIMVWSSHTRHKKEIT